MDDQQNTAINKLLTDKVPVRIQRHRYRIEELEAEIAKLDQARRSGKVKLLRPRARKPIDRRLADLRGAVDELRDVWIDGFLTPLTVRDVWECRYQYTALRLYLKRKQGDKKLGVEGIQADDEAIELTCDNALLAMQIACALKAKDQQDGKWVQLMTYDDASRLDSRILMELWAIYAEKLALTQDELKKSAAPTSQAG